MQTAISTLFPVEVAVGVGRTADMDAPLLPEEEVLIQGVSDRRYREFALGRVVARRALTELGVTGFPILIGIDRAPVWPAGVTGSISHCEGLCTAVVASEGRVSSLGVDVEVARSLPPDIVEMVCTPNELKMSSALPSPPTADWAMFTFSAKESVYKALNPLTGLRLDFHDVEVEFRPAQRAFEVCFVSADAHAGVRGYRMVGRFGASRLHLTTGLTVLSGDSGSA